MAVFDPLLPTSTRSTEKWKLGPNVGGLVYTRPLNRGSQFASAYAGEGCAMLEHEILSNRQNLFGAEASYLTLIDLITPVVSKYEYSFFSDEWFSKWMESEEFTIQQLNAITSNELIEKAHLAAVSALYRAKRWADAICLMHRNDNLIGWAASVRGFLESAGDTVDGLHNIPLILAENQHSIKLCLSGGETRFADFSPLCACTMDAHKKG